MFDAGASIGKVQPAVGGVQSIAVQPESLARMKCYIAGCDEKGYCPHCVCCAPTALGASGGETDPTSL